MSVDASEQIEKFLEFFERDYKDEIHNALSKGKKAITVDFSDLSRFDPELADQLLEEPEETIKASEMAVGQLFTEDSLRVRYKNFPPSQNILIRNIRSHHLDKFIEIDGIVRQASDVRPEVVSAKFECPSCGNIITMLQTESKFREPSRCTCGRKGRFRLLSKDLVDAQRLVIEEPPHLLEGGAQPKRISVFLREDLVDPKMEKNTTPGTNVEVTGVVKEVAVHHRDGGISTRFEIVMNANHIESMQEDFIDLDVNIGEEEKIRKLAKDKKIYSKLIASIAPSIYGHERIKEAVLLQMFGGVRKQKKDGTVTRGDLHVLLVGDPGAGKSTLLTFVNTAAPKSRYIAGRSASGAGVTATVVKDEFLRGWALEAGAIVLADKGILLLDEMDKMSPEDTSALHEAMEQQQISIAKANIQATLRAQTSVLAGANPKLGRFDPFTPIANQINLPPALINRFDLIFIVRDLPNKELDSKIAQQILENQSYQDKEPEVPVEILRKYVAYAKQKIFPKLTEDARRVIKEYYIRLRNSGTNGDEAIKPIPISARQIEAIVRLAEACARIRLSDKITKPDAKRAIDLLAYSLSQVGVDSETGQIDIDKIYTGITASARSKIVTVRDIIFSLDEQGKKTIEIAEIQKIASEKGIQPHKVEEAIEKLKRSGDIFEPKKGWIQRI